ncbi:response regulator, partial [bacterium]
SLIDRHNLTNLTSKEEWDKTTYFNAYKTSFQQGEYNIKEPVYTPTGQVIRSYFSGGIKMADMSPVTFEITGSPVGNKSYLVPIRLENGVLLAGSPLQNTGLNTSQIELLRKEVASYIMTRHDLAAPATVVLNRIFLRIESGELSQDDIDVGKIYGLFRELDHYLSEAEFAGKDPQRLAEIITALKNTCEEMRLRFAGFKSPQDLRDDINYILAILSPEPEISSLNLEESLRWIIEKYEKKHGFQVNFSIAPAANNAYVMGNKYQLRRVIANLFSNTADAAKDKGIHDVVIRVALDVKDGKYSITYQDNAGGIPAHLIDRLFEPGVTSKNKPFSGYGMAICRDIIEKMAGTIAVKNDPGKAATFSIELPVAASSPTISNSSSPVYLSSEKLKLLYNRMMDNLLTRFPGQKEGPRELTEEFLAMDHPEVKKIFSRVDSLSDEEILDRVDAFLRGEGILVTVPGWLKTHTSASGSERRLTLRELFLRPTAGDKDLYQIFVTGLAFSFGDIRLSFDRNPEEKKKAIEEKYLIIKALEILSRKADLVLINEADIDELYAYLLSTPVSSKTALSLVLLTDVLEPFNTPQSQRSLRNLLTLIDKLQAQDERWRDIFSSGECKIRLNGLRMVAAVAAGASGINSTSSSVIAKTLLYVEDDDFRRLTTSRALKRAGFNVIEASNGKVALDIVQKGDSHIDLIITDIRMPEMDGTRLVNALGHIKKSGGVMPPIIIYAGFPTEAKIIQEHLDSLDIRRLPKSSNADLVEFINERFKEMDETATSSPAAAGSDSFEVQLMDHSGIHARSALFIAFAIRDVIKFFYPDNDAEIRLSLKDFPKKEILLTADEGVTQDNLTRLDLMVIAKTGAAFISNPIFNITIYDANKKRLGKCKKIISEVFQLSGKFIGASENSIYWLRDFSLGWLPKRMKEISGEDTGSSPLGGIDMRHLAKNAIIENRDSPLRGQSLFSSAGRSASGTDPNELQEIQRLIQAGIIPATKRLEECRGACSAEALLSCIADILRIEEERVTPTEAGLKNLLASL